MKKIFFLFMMIAIVPFAFADNTKDVKDSKENKAKIEKTASIFGKVVDKETGEELAGALVQVKGSNISTYTDFGGNFSINNLESTNGTVVVSYISYKEHEIRNIKYQVRNNSGIKVELESL